MNERNKSKKLTLETDRFHLELDLAEGSFTFCHKKRPDVEMVVAYADIGFRVRPRANARIVENPMEGGITIQ